MGYFVLGLIAVILILPSTIWRVYQWHCSKEAVKKMISKPFVCPNCGHRFYTKQKMIFSLSENKAYLKCPACNKRVTVLGHPWYHGKGIWYEDFGIIPRSMNADIAAALKENGKYVERNVHFFRSDKATEKFRYQYAEFLRELFEMGIPVTYGSDSHNNYGDARGSAEAYLAAAGFCNGDVSEISEDILWKI